MNALLTQEEQEEIEEYEDSFWTMSPPRSHKCDRRRELEEKRWGANTIDGILNEGLKFDVERLNSKGHHVRDGYRGVLTFEDSGEEYLFSFDSGLEDGDLLDFEVPGTEISQSYKLRENIKSKNALIEYLEDNFDAEFTY